ncbi:MAG: dihydroorotate dehydrogenase (quinone), partial [Capnocytophaga sp.]|nr:dihydroorotate dehydrogenase (quinone) [Capnocytophaga sp.]
MYKQIIQPLLFSMDAEKAHHFTFSSLKFLHKIPGIAPLMKRIYSLEHPSLEREVFGIKFKNPIGLAAGLDKDARLYN